jgi:nitrile hydratase
MTTESPHHDHDHDHDHDHAHPAGTAPHRHPPQPDDPEPPLAARIQEEALRSLLIEKGVLSARDLGEAMEAMDARGEEQGARIVARAWADPGFRQLLRERPALALRQFAIEMGVNELCVVENTPEVHNVVVCTLCSCYPRMILGVPPAWYKSREYRSRVVREPRAVLIEFGTVLPDTVDVRVHDSNADLRYLVVPMRPAGTDGWDEARLAGLVSRDSMIGVTSARAAEGA